MVEEVKQLSEVIWQAKLSNDMTSVEKSISDKARFVHMGITFDKAGELAAFNDKLFIYHSFDLSQEKIENYGQTVIIYKKGILTAEVGGNIVQNPFVISEVFTKSNEGCLLAAETYTRIATDYETYELR